jgi:glyoxylase-like metal-dependent hydrolase (beta-lactamase superfamily II)
MGVADINLVLENSTRITRVIITHTHNDHIGGLASLVGNPEVIILKNKWGKDNLTKGVRPTKEKLGLNEYVALNALDFDQDFRPSEAVAELEIPGYPEDKIREVEEGDKIEYGNGDSFLVVAAPGHSDDGMFLWDEENGILAMGDMGYDGLLYGHMNESDFEKFRDSINKIYDLTRGKIKFILPGHNQPIHVGSDLLDRIHFLVNNLDHPSITKTAGSDEYNPYYRYQTDGRLGILIKRDPLEPAA